jgi:hypothetical protein
MSPGAEEVIYGKTVHLNLELELFEIRNRKNNK